MASRTGSCADFALEGSIHALPKVRVVERVPRLLELGRGRRVIDLGFVDTGRMADKQSRGSWLHQQLSTVARELVGIDLHEEGVRIARELGFDAHVADCQSAEDLARLGLEPAEVVVGGELIEHLDRPGAFLEAVKPLVAPGGLLALTTPNGLSLTNFAASLVRRELVNPDHVAWYSWRTASTLLVRHGWVLRELDFYPFPRFELEGLRGADRAKVRAFNLYHTLIRPLFRVSPSLADGLILVAQSAD